MNNSGTFEPENGLSVTTSEEDQFNALVEAVSTGTEGVWKTILEEPSNVPDATTEGEQEAGQSPASEVDTTTTAEDTHSTDDAEQASTRDNQQDVATSAAELAALRAELQQLRSSAGRVPALQSQLQQLQRELKVRQTVEAAKPAPAPVEDESAKKLKERIQALKEIDPTTAEILEDMAKAIKPEAPAATSQAEDLDALIRKATEDAVLETEFNRVVAVHPDAPTIFDSIEWKLWKNKLTPEQRSWAESSNADQVSTAVTAFKEFVNGFGVQAPPASAPAAAVVDVTQQARQRKLEGSTQTTTAPVRAAAQQDTDTMFNEYYEEALKSQGIKV